jgi:septal ring factor EnvC (AmiA/AmiB activator)
MKPAVVFAESTPKTKLGFFRHSSAGDRGHGAVRSAVLLVTVLIVTAAAQTPPGSETQRRLDERIRALQKESEALAQQAQTLVAELRALEVERDLRVEQAQQAEADAARAQKTLVSLTTRLAELERQRAAQLPDLENQLVDLYKRGRARYVQLLLSATGLRDFARTTRAVAALASINERRVTEHQRTLEALSMERATLERTTVEFREREAAAREARAAAERAVTARSALIARIDSRRDLTAQYAGELQVVYDRLQQQFAAGSGRGAAAAVPLGPFKGGLEWPANGRVTGRFGQAADRLGGTAVRNGIEISATEDSPVRAVHGGTVGFADVFTGFGNLVIIDHGGNNYSLYGYLRTISVEAGAAIDAGDELGRVGPSPAGPPALYFEIRIDGRSVDPLQWLRQR